jgi:4-hydroxy-tetrahydrodipicolinate synthase
MVTPFTESGELDGERTAALAKWLVDRGNDGLVLAGTTGESPVLTDEERTELWRVVRAAVDVPLVAGSTTNDTAHSVAMTEAAHELGMDGILAVTPYYNRPSQAGLDAHFRAVAAASPLPVLLYDIPIRTGRKISTELIVRLAEEVPTIVGLKDAAANPAETARLISLAPDDFEVYSGDDGMTLPFLSVGAVGVIGVATHWCAPEMSEMIAAFFKGDVERARELNARMLPSFGYETSDAAPNPLPTKAMLEVLGQSVGTSRLPMGPPPDGLADQARAVAEGLGLL